MDWICPLRGCLYIVLVFQAFYHQTLAEITTVNSKRKSQTSQQEVFPREVTFDIEDSEIIDTLKLKRNPHIDINVPMCHTDHGDVICEQGNRQDVAFYQSKDQTGAFALKLSKDNATELDGFVVTNNTAYIVEPAGKLANVFHNNSHYIRKRSAGIMLNRRQSYFTQYFGHNLARVSRRQVDPYDNYIPESDYNDMPTTFTVELLILIDNSLYNKFLKKHGTDEDTMTKLRYYFTHIVNGIDLRFTSINNTDFHIKIKLAGFYVAKKPSDMPFVLAFSEGSDDRAKVDGSSTLSGLTNFLKKSTHLPKHDHAMFFTEHDATNGRGYILGTSYLSGICTSMSTSVIVDHGSYNSGGIAAHELGHNLGVIHHDGDSVPEAMNCPSAMNYIMAPSSAIINRKTVEFSFKFSECSIYQMKQQVLRLRERNSNCLNQDNGGSGTSGVMQPFLSVPPGQLMDVHAQCQEIYGNTSFMCPPTTIDEMCYKMYCYDPTKRICITASEQRAAIGTSCGDKKWCMLGKCIHDENAPSVPDTCPFPDVPPPKANCEQDASPFQCQDPVFKRRCCQSCSKNFTEEDYCKDTRILINGLSCFDFVSNYGTYVCNLDPSFKDFCCHSCHVLEQNVPTTFSPETTMTDCTDNKFVRINGYTCQDFIAQNGQTECARPLVSKHCCRSCYFQ